MVAFARGRMRTRLAVSLLLVALMTGYTPATALTAAAPGVVTARWSASSLLVRAFATIEGTFTVSGSGHQTVIVHLPGARFFSLPEGCADSTTVKIRSRISSGGDVLSCYLHLGDGSSRSITFHALVVAKPGQVVRGAVHVKGGRSYQLPGRIVVPGTPPPVTSLRLLSSPCFLNADVADLARGPNYWAPSRTANSINDGYRRALTTVLDDWKSLDPDAVLVAGDLVGGWWGVDPSRSGNFGPVETLAQRRAALARAAATVYPQWLERFTRRGLDVLPAMGDHEYGDNDWGPEKRALAGSFEAAFAKHLGHLPRALGTPVSRPSGTARASAYAIRPSPEVQLITLNVFDITPRRASRRLDAAQMTWLRAVLSAARRDGVSWIIVQGHTPILTPVRSHASSNLHYDGGANSELWRVFKNYGVDLYLAGEVHDVTAIERDGITQITHGGVFHLGQTNYLVLDVTDEYAYLTLRDYDSEQAKGPRRSKLWESRPSGLPRKIRVAPDPFTIGTAVLLPSGDLTRQSGMLRPGRQ